ASWIESELGATVIDWPQSNLFAAREYERLMEAIRAGWLWHAGDAGLTAHAMNAVARILPMGDAKFDRPSQTRDSAEQDRRVIDALKSLAMVHSAAVEAADRVPTTSEPEFFTV
ncbi:MAG TPA: hypothetical protein VIU37_07505, partial [Candidatus Limnocylindrales bacterium]